MTPRLSLTLIDYLGMVPDFRSDQGKHYPLLCSPGPCLCCRLVWVPQFERHCPVGTRPWASRGEGFGLQGG